MKNIHKKRHGQDAHATNNFGGPFGNCTSISGFTIVELLVIIGIVAVLVCALTPIVMHMRGNARILTQKFNFQSIESALEAYHQQFGDYPRNPLLPKWNTMQEGASTAPTPAPRLFFLATALLGPGPAVTEPVHGEIQTGDGCDGPGFRSHSIRQFSGTASADAGSALVTVTVDQQDEKQAAAFVRNFQMQGTGATLASITFFPSAQQPFQETIGIAGINQLPHRLQLTLTAAPSYPHNDRCEVSVADGKVWGPFLAPGAFKVAYVPSVDSYGSPFAEFGQPVLIDNWGQVIQYFPRYGPVSNRTADSVDPADASLSAGPLYGYSQPKSIDPVNGQNAMFDWRDGAPFFTVIGQLGPAQPWPNPGAPGARYFRPELAIEWMLGDSDDSGEFSNTIKANRKIIYEGPYILISAGPEGPQRPNGGYCNFADPNNGNKPLPANNLGSTFISSGNIYNFERP